MQTLQFVLSDEKTDDTVTVTIPPGLLPKTLEAGKVGNIYMIHIPPHSSADLHKHIMEEWQRLMGDVPLLIAPENLTLTRIQIVDDSSTGMTQ